MEAAEINTFIKVLLWACGTILTIGGAASMIVRMFGPYKKLKAKVAALEAIVESHNTKLQNDLARFESNDERDNLMMDALYTIVEHMRTNNSTGLMNETSKKLQRYLIHRKVIK